MPTKINAHGLRANVLIVEDEYFVAEDLAEAFRDVGLQVLGPVPTVSEALRLIRGELVHVAVLDMNLHEEMAFPVADLLLDRGIPFVFASGYDEKAVPKSYECIPRWEKPFEADEVVRFVSDLIVRRAEQR